MISKQLKRRDAIRNSLGFMGLLVSGQALANAVNVCKPTPVQPEGPFYPVDEQLDSDNDLTKVPDATSLPSGQRIYVMGTVRDANCQPVADTLVEIWQACASGRYNHPGDTNPAPLDKNFQYFGKTATDANGNYIFKTIVPGEYPAGDGWIRPPHIHFKVAKRGFRELITQMYFADHPLNDADLILRQLPANQRTSVIIPLEPPTEGFDPEAKIARFHITLHKLV